MAGWMKQTYASAGVTQWPPGPRLADLTALFAGGTVILLLDVSGSMSGERIAQAKAGCEGFIREALGGGYQVGMGLWHSGLADSTPLSPTGAGAKDLVKQAMAGGGNCITGPIRWAQQELRSIDSNDRVIAIFGDGDLGIPDSEAQQLAVDCAKDDIRILTMGLGDASASALSVIATEKTPAQQSRTSTETLRDDLQGMARGMISHRK